MDSWKLLSVLFLFSLLWSGNKRKDHENGLAPRLSNFYRIPFWKGNRETGWTIAKSLFFFFFFSWWINHFADFFNSFLVSRGEDDLPNILKSCNALWWTWEKMKWILFSLESTKWNKFLKFAAIDGLPSTVTA